jgi:hypothetical protein
MRAAGRIILLASLVALAPAAVAQAATFSNPTPIDVPGCQAMDCAFIGSANPYPSTITVSGLPDGVSKVRATLKGLTHTDSGSVQVLLVGPGGQDTILMRRVCAGSLTSATFVFDDAAAGSLPLSAPCPSGTYKPSSGPGTSPAFHPNAPPPPYDLSMSVFNGGPANGTWRLFVEDSGTTGTGVISGGWSLELATGTCAGRSASEPAHVGTAGDDVLTGTEGPDVMVGLGGNDTLNGLGGGDVICGGDGNDKELGGPGNDLLLGEAGADKLKGDGGKDKLKGGSQKDLCVGGAKPDKAKGCEKRKSI